MMLKTVLKNDLYHCNHLALDEKAEIDIPSISLRTGNTGNLSKYIQFMAFLDEDSNNMRTYLVRDNKTNEIVGFFSIKAGLMSLNEGTINDTDLETQKSIFSTIPGVEIANFAVNYSYIRKYPKRKGIGALIFKEFILPIIRTTAENIGVKIIYLFALPYKNLIEHYEKYGFNRLDEMSEKLLHARLKPEHNKSCIFMYYVL